MIGLRRSQGRARDARPGDGATPRTGRRKGRAPRGVLWIIALMLVGSGVLRLGGETGLAIANGIATVMEDQAASQEESCAPPPEIAQVLAMLKDRETALADREAAMADRMQALAVAEEQIERNLVALQEAEASLEETLALSSTAAEDDLARLTAVYENMKPKEAAPLFAAMDPEFAAGFLGRMRAAAAAAILAKLDPAAAYSISVLLAGRNAGAPTQ